MTSNKLRHDGRKFIAAGPIIGYNQMGSCRRPVYLRYHLAFKADSRDEVDRLHAELKEIGAMIVDVPRLYTEYGPNYYAVFFKDLEGIKYEIVCNKSGEG